MLSRSALMGQAPDDGAPLARGRAELAEDGELCARVLAATGARHAGVTPARAASSAKQIPRARRQVLLRPGKVAQLRRATAFGAVKRGARAVACRPRLSVEGFEHRTKGGSGQEPVDDGL